MGQSACTFAEKQARFTEQIHNNKIEAMVGQELVKHYPGYRWWVEARLLTGLCAIQCETLGGDYGFYIPIVQLLNETDNPKLVLRAGGEMLERYGLPRGPRPDNLVIDRDRLGVAIGDTDATK